MLGQFLKGLFSFRGAKKDILKGKRILLIEDGEIERKVYPHALESAGCVVHTSADCRTGLIASQEKAFDLILLDYLLPDGNGIEVCKELKSNPKTKDIPVVFLTGSVKPEGVIGCYEAGADCYLSKPIGSVTLIRQVELSLLP